MNIRHDIRPVTYLKARTAAILDQINSTRSPVIITQDGEPRAVIQDTESYENMQKAVALMKLIAQSETDIKKGRIAEQDCVFTALAAKLKKRRNAGA